jgi:hypothetical protein
MPATAETLPELKKQAMKGRMYCISRYASRISREAGIRRKYANSSNSRGTARYQQIRQQQQRRLLQPQECQQQEQEYQEKRVAGTFATEEKSSRQENWKKIKKNSVKPDCFIR